MFIALSVISRARYLRLPTAAPRHSGQAVRSAPPPKPKPSTSSPAYLSIPTAPLRPSSPASTDAGPSSPPVSRAPPRSRLYQGGRLSIASLLSERPKSPERPDRRALPKLSTTSPSRPRLTTTRASTVRDPSPARSTSTYGGATKRSDAAASASPSTFGAEVGRSRLWQELRGIQSRSSRAPTEGGRSRGDPP